MKHRQRIASAVMVVFGFWGVPRAQAVPISQRESPPPPANEAPPAPATEVPPATRPPPTSAAGPGQRIDSDTPPALRPRKSPDEPATNSHVGIGYKVGNGLGFVGFDAIISPVAHVALDFQISMFSVSSSAGNANGLGLAPMLQLYFNDPGRSTVYAGLGWIHAAASVQNINASVNGVAANVGYEWKWQSGFAIQVGGGVAMLGAATATDGFNTVSINGGIHPNLEIGFRYMLM